MVKMLKLIQNEYIKVMKKLSTKIIFILIALLAVGVVGIAKFAVYMNEKYEAEYEDSYTSDYSYEINEAKEMKYDGYEKDLEMLEFLQENKISRDSWRYQAVIDAFSDNSETADVPEDFDPEMFGEDFEMEAEPSFTAEQREELKNIVKNGDWKDYCRIKVDASKKAGVSEEKYWLYKYCFDNDIKLPESYSESLEYPYSIVEQISDLKQGLADFDEATASTQELAEIAEVKDELKLAEYQLEKDYKVNIAKCSNMFMADEMNFWAVFGTSASLVSVIGLLLIIITGGSIASEFSNGTIKFLLINPIKRWKILLSKYIMSISLGFVMMIFLYVLSALTSMIFFGTSLLDVPYLHVVNGQVEEINGFLFMIRRYLFNSVEVIVMATLAFAISSLIRSSSLAIGVSVFSMLAGNTVVMIMKQALNIDWARYLIFANTDLESVINGTTYFSHHSLPFALTVIGVHMVVFLLTAWDGFTRREV